MLDISTRAKELAMQGSTRKNLRIHFPNGEREDITNENLVSESMSFTESVLSDDNFHFGTAEASVLDFQTIGVGNIDGCKIEASIEMLETLQEEVITQEDLDAYDKNELRIELTTKLIRQSSDIKISIKAPSMFDTFNLDIFVYDKRLNVVVEKRNLLMIGSINNYSVDTSMIKGDKIVKLIIGNIYCVFRNITLSQEEFAYPIPLGRFTVESSKRQRNPLVRNVTAYGKEFLFDKLSSAEMQKRKEIAYRNATREYYDYDVFSYIASNFFYGDELTKRTLVERVSDSGLTRAPIELNNLYSVKFTVKTARFPIDTEEKYKSLYYSDNRILQDSVYKNLKSDMKNKINSWLVELGITNFYGVDSAIKEIIGSIFPSAYIGILTNGMRWDDDSKYMYIYPFFENERYDKENIYIAIPFEATLGLYETGNTTPIEEIDFVLNPNPELYVVDTSEFYKITNVEKNDFVNNYANPRSITESYIELMGKFGRMNRKGLFEFLSVDKPNELYPSEDLYPSETLYPAGIEKITRSMYTSILYDDNYTKPFSKIICNFTETVDDKEEKRYYEHIIREVDEEEEQNYKVYDLSNNYLISNGSWTIAEVAEFMERMAPNIDEIRYLPCDIELFGLPYIEAGDYIEVITQDGSFKTIVLNRNLSGIQRLTDNFTSN